MEADGDANVGETLLDDVVDAHEDDDSEAFGQYSYDWGGDGRVPLNMNLKPTDAPTPFEEALDRSGNGLYNYLLVFSCGLGLLAIGIDLFGFSLVVAAACDLNLSVSQKGILTSLPFVGILLVSYIWGYVSDTKGRKFSLVVSLLAAFILSSIASISTNWIFLGVIKFISVCFSCATNSVVYTMVGESCTQRIRSKYMVLMTCMLLLSPGIGAVFSYPILGLQFVADIPLLGITFKPWRLLTIVLAMPMGFAGVIMLFFHESPKFLANQGKTKEALAVLSAIYSMNNKNTKEEYGITSVELNEAVRNKEMPLLRAMYEQSAPLFRPPLLWRTLQLFYIVAIVYLVNNTLLVWLPHILGLVGVAMESDSGIRGSICYLLTHDQAPAVMKGNETVTTIKPNVCTGVVEEKVIITLMGAQFIFSVLNLIISYLPFPRRMVVLFIITLSAVSGVLMNVTPETISSVFFFMLFSCTNLVMGIMASYFVDLYPTSCRGMASCLSIMVGRTSTFIGINVVGNLIFTQCYSLFYIGAALALSAAAASWYLPPDEPAPKDANAT